MWLKFNSTYHNLDRANTVSFRKQTIAFNLKTGNYFMLNCRFQLSEHELKFMNEAFEAALELKSDIFDLDFLFCEVKKERGKRRTKNGVWYDSSGGYSNYFCIRDL